MTARSIAALYVLLSLPLILWALIILPDYFMGPEIPSAVVYGIVAASPLVGGDISIFGEITPILLAGGVIALLPNSKKASNMFAAAEAILIYVLYIQLSVFFSTGKGVALLYSIWADIAGPQKTLLGIISNFRIMAIVIAASIFGFKVKGQQQMR